MYLWCISTTKRTVFLSFDSTLFRQVMGQFPTGVAVLTLTPEPIGITINSLTSVSLSPSLILFCLKKQAQAHDKVISSSHFSINFLAYDQADLALLCTKAGGALLDTEHYKLADRGIARIKGCVASIDCSHQAIYPGGDHTIVVGNVLALERQEGLLPLVFHGSKFKGLVEPVTSSSAEVVNS